MKVGEAKRFTGWGVGLSKRSWKWNTPWELQKLATKQIQPMLGLGRWSGNGDHQFWCLTNGKDTIYLTANTEPLKQIRRQAIK